MSTINTIEDLTATSGLAETDLFLAPNSSGQAFKATGAELRTFTNAGAVDLTTATLTVTAATHGGRVVSLNKADGITITLPAATGTGTRYFFGVTTTLTSDGVIQVANATDVINGGVIVATDTSGLVVPTAATSDTITMNGTTTGGIKGSNLILTDVASGLFTVSGFLVASGAEATPFSAAVS